MAEAQKRLAREYETTYLIKPETPDEQVDEIKERLRAEILDILTQKSKVADPEAIKRIETVAQVVDRLEHEYRQAAGRLAHELPEGRQPITPLHRAVLREVFGGDDAARFLQANRDRLRVPVALFRRSMPTFDVVSLPPAGTSRSRRTIRLHHPPKARR